MAPLDATLPPVVLLAIVRNAVPLLGNVQSVVTRVLHHPLAQPTLCVSTDSFDKRLVHVVDPVACGPFTCWPQTTHAHRHVAMPVPTVEVSFLFSDLPFLTSVI